MRLPMKLFVDSNIAIDYLKMREPFFGAARKLMTLGSLGELDLWMSTTQASDLFYILSLGGKKSLAAQIKEQLRTLRKSVHMIGLSEVEFDAALVSNWEDVEDACVYQAALKVKAQAIITRNKDDFQMSSIRVFTADELFDYLRDEKGFIYEELFAALEASS